MSNVRPMPSQSGLTGSGTSRCVNRQTMTDLAYTCGYRKHWSSSSPAADTFDRIRHAIAEGKVTRINLWERGAVLEAKQLDLAARLPHHFDMPAFLRLLKLHSVRPSSQFDKSFDGSNVIEDN